MTFFAVPAIAGLGSVWSDFQYYASDFKNYLANNLSSTLKPLEAQTQTAINNSSGSLGIPNPNIATKSTREHMNQYSIAEKFDNNSAVRGAMVTNEINRKITLGAVEGVLGKNGQSRIKNKLQNTEKAVNDITNIAHNAANNKKQKQIEIKTIAAANPLPDISMASNLNPLSSIFNSAFNNQAKLSQLTWEGLADLELQNINIQAGQSKILAATLSTTLQLHQDLQYSNLNLINVSGQLDEINRARRVDNSAEAARLIRVASQNDLLGRKN